MMKLTILLTWVPVAVQAAAIALERPTHFGTVVRRDEDPNDYKGQQIYGNSIQSRKLAKTVEVTAVSGVAGAKRVKYIYGPFKVRGVGDTSKLPNTFPSMDKGGTAYNFNLADDFPRDITVLLATSKLLDKDMKPVTLEDQVYNHHNAFMEVMPKQDETYACEGGSPAKQPPAINLFAGTSTEKIEFNFTSSEPQKVKTGFHIPKDAAIQNMVDLVNHGPTREFYTENEVEFLPGLPEGYVNSKQIMMNPNICGGEDGYALHPPAGQTKFTIKSQGVIMNTSGWLMRQRGHLHDGGNDITLTVNGKDVCVSKAMYGGPGFEFNDAKSGKTIATINKSTECIDPFLLKKGDRVQISANFDLDAHPSRPMGGGDAPESAHGGMKNVLDGGNAEQMSVMFIYFAKLND